MGYWRTRHPRLTGRKTGQLTRKQGAVQKHSQLPMLRKINFSIE